MAGFVCVQEAMFVFRVLADHVKKKNALPQRWLVSACVSWGLGEGKGSEREGLCVHLLRWNEKNLLERRNTMQFGEGSTI